MSAFFCKRKSNNSGLSLIHNKNKPAPNNNPSNQSIAFPETYFFFVLLALAAGDDLGAFLGAAADLVVVLGFLAGFLGALTSTFSGLGNKEAIWVS
jgi:hypothetical protein